MDENVKLIILSLYHQKTLTNSVIKSQYFQGKYQFNIYL